MKSGIYKILFPSGKRYIGSSKNLPVRIMQHLTSLSKNNHVNRFLQAEYNNYSGCGISFSIIETCSEADLLKIEQVYLNSIKPELNISMTAGTNDSAKGISNETREKMSAAAKKRVVSAGTRKKMSDSRKAIIAKGDSGEMKRLSVLSKLPEPKKRMAQKLIGNKNAVSVN